MLRRQVRHRAEELSPGPARAVPDQAHQLRHPAAREAEGQAHLRRAREPVPALLRHGRAGARGHRREPAQAARAPAGQCRVPPGHGRLAPRGAPDGRSRPHPGQQSQGLHPLVHREGGRGGAAPLHVQDAGAGRRQSGRGPRADRRLDRSGRQREERHRARAAHPGRHPDPGTGADDRGAVLQVERTARERRDGMARIPFQKPKTIEWQILSDRYGRLVAEPFEKGYALTVGNSLRRTLLSIIPGAAVTWARVKGVKEVETPLPGVAESTQDVLLNLKKLAVNVPSGEPMETRLEAQGPKAVTGADVSEATGVEVLNPELHIATLEAGATLAIDLGIGVGRGYVSDDLPLPARAINALKNSEILLVADLVQKTDADLEQVKNLGDKSIEEIKTALAALGLSLGMRIDPNLLGTLGRGGVK